MKYRAYNEYKNSGLEWLPDLPRHWAVRRLKDVGALISGTGFSQALQGESENEYPFYKVGDLEESSDGRYMARSSNSVTRETAKEIGARIIPAWSVVWAKIGAALLLNRRRITVFDCCIDNNMTGFVPNTNSLNVKWAYYWTSQIDFAEVANPGAVPSIGESYQAVLPISVPPKREQDQICYFLDHEAARIDALIEEQQRLIDLLQEKRQAVISHAVTKGLDPDVAMKNSGVEWLGDVPEHWDVTRVKWVAKLESGHTPSNSVPEYWQNCDIPWVSLNDSKALAEGDYIQDTKYKVNQLGLANSSAHVLPERVVVFTRDATIGLAAITTKPMAVSQHLIAWVCGENILPEFLVLVFYAMEEELQRSTFGATVKTIGMPEVRRMITTLPSLAEQQEIVGHVNKTRSDLTEAENDANNLITLLRERRSALISAAVTGKIDVRNWQRQDEAEQPDYAMAAEESAAYGASP